MRGWNIALIRLLPLIRLEMNGDLGVDSTLTDLLRRSLGVRLGVSVFFLGIYLKILGMSAERNVSYLKILGTHRQNFRILLQKMVIF